MSDGYIQVAKFGTRLICYGVNEINQYAPGFSLLSSLTDREKQTLKIGEGNLGSPASSVPCVVTCASIEELNRIISRKGLPFVFVDADGPEEEPSPRGISATEQRQVHRNRRERPLPHHRKTRRSPYSPPDPRDGPRSGDLALHPTNRHSPGITLCTTCGKLPKL